MRNRDYQVQALALGSQSARIAYDVVFGDFIRLIRSQEDYAENRERIRPAICREQELYEYAAAFLEVFDRYRQFLMFLRNSRKDVPTRIVTRLLGCPPAGAIVQPAWTSKYQCGQLLCPWCRYRQVLNTVREGWADPFEQVHTYRILYPATSLRKLQNVRKQARTDRHRLLRRLEKPYIRFQRVGLERENNKPVYRYVLMAASRSELLSVPRNWEYAQLPYHRVLEAGFRYAAMNLLGPRELLADLLKLKRVRTVETCRT